MMSSFETIDALNRLLAILCRSFPQYLSFSRPYIPPSRERVVEMLEEVVTGQNRLADRISLQIVESGSLPDTGEFPMEFTDLHDLGIDFLIREAVQYQKQDVATLTQIADSLHLAPAAKSLAEESLGMAKGHLELLEELLSSQADLANV